MKKIQIIQYSSRIAEEDGVTYSPLNAPRAIDDFDINIIDLSAQKMWTHTSDTIGKVDAYRDLKTIQQMVFNKRKAIVIYALPQNIHYTYDTHYSTAKQERALKDILDGVQKTFL